MTYSELVALADLHEVALDEHKLRWARVVAAAEREACAKIAEGPLHRHKIAAAIRTRGEQ